MSALLHSKTFEMLVSKQLQPALTNATNKN